MATSTDVISQLNESVPVGMFEGLTLDVQTVQHSIQVQNSQAAFLKNMSQQLFSTGQFSDVTLVVGDQRFQAHKLILATSSSFFKRMFYGESWKEGDSSDVNLEETPSCKDVFNTFLSYFYCGTVAVTNSTIIPLITLADKYDVEGLKEVCSQSIANVVREECALEAAFQWLTFAEQMRMHSLQESCKDLICFNFDKSCTLSGWLSMPLEKMLALINRSDVVTESEYNVFQAVQKWCLNNSVTEKVLKTILRQVQFKNMTAEQLHHVEKSELASMTVCKEHNVLTPFVNAGFRFIALRSHYPQGDNTPAEYQRYYTAGSNLSTATFSDTESGRCANLTSVCTITSEAKEYTWLLEKCGNATCSKYQVKVPRVVRGEEGLRAYYELPENIRLTFALIIRNKNGHAFVLNRSVVTQIPYIKGQTLVDFHECPGYEPHDVVYSFSIEKHDDPEIQRM